MPLRWVLLLSFMAEVALLTGALSWLSIRHGEETAASTIEDLGQWTAIIVKEKVKTHFEQPELLLKVNQASSQSGQLDLSVAGAANQQRLQRLFWEQVRLSSAARTIYYTDTDGNLLQVENGSIPTLSLRSPETAPNWEIYALEENGQRGKRIKQEPFDPRDRDWYKNTVQRQDVTWSSVYRFQDPPVLGLTVSAPIFTADQEIQGVLSVDLSLEEISQFLRGLNLNRRVKVAIIQRNGTVVATSESQAAPQVEATSEADLGAAVLGDRRSNTNPPQSNAPSENVSARDMSRSPTPLATVEDPWLQAAGQWIQGLKPDQTGGAATFSTVLSAENGESLLVQKLPLVNQRGMNWQLVVIAPEADFRQGISETNRDTVLLTLGAIALALVSSAWLAKRLARPIQQVSEAAEAIAGGDLNVKVSPSRVTEANTLTRAFNRMAVQLVHSFKAWEEANQHLETTVSRRTAAVRQSEEKFAKMFRSSPNPIVISTFGDGRILDANDRFFEILQYHPQEVVGKTAQDLNLWLYWSQREAIARDLEQYGVVHSREIVFRSRWGDHHTLLISAELATLDNQLCILWSGNDITEQKQTEAALREKEEYLRSILDSIPQHVFWKDVDLNFLGCNRNWSQAAGLGDPAEVIGKTDYDLITDKNAAADFRLQDRNIIDTGEPLWHQVAPKQKAGPNGETRWLDISKVPIKGDSGEVIGLLGVIDDITLRKQAEEALQLEKERSEQLLLNILPQAIATQLKQSASLDNPAAENKPIASNYESVSILFADIVGFTGLSAQLTPIELVDWLNRLFSEFDRLAEQYNLEKIKTIGDAYMVAAGLPTPIDEPAAAIANMALEMRDTIETLEPEFIAKFNRPLDIRIGINSGPVIAGVIGIKKFIYDLWGDTVNIASRMESHGEPGQIQVTEATYQEISEQFHFKYRGEIDVKGRGQMKTYWLLERRSPASFTEQHPSGTPSTALSGSAHHSSTPNSTTNNI
ncbi:MAG: adenylate/guanylate cyclase domain-containing protein [Cyanobacteria bacterium P01_C01_bin.89]